MAKTHEQFVAELCSISPKIEVIGQYTKAIDRIKVKCMQCGKVWSPRAYSLMQGKSCPHCSAISAARNNNGITGTKSDSHFREELKKRHPYIEPKSTYSNNKDAISFLCKRCGHQWKAKPYSLLQGHGCPRCTKSGTSFMEQFILSSFQKALGKEKVLSRDRSLIGMELDVYIPELSLAIEPGNWHLHKRSINRDCQKRELCKQKQVSLITIYDMYPIDKEPPFSNDCFVFSEDYNKSDHTNIRELVKTLFDRANIDCFFTENDWVQIESEAYNNALSKTHESFINELKTISPTIQVLDKYQNSNKRILVRCNVCNYEWNAVPANLLNGDGCKKCGTKKAHQKYIKPQKDFVQEVNRVNPSIEIIGDYTGRHKPVKARCTICGYVWEPKASSLLRGSSHKGAISIHKSINANHKD